MTNPLDCGIIITQSREHLEPKEREDLSMTNPMFLYSIQFCYLGENREINIPLDRKDCVDLAHKMYLDNEAEIDHICVVDNYTGEVVFHIDVMEEVVVNRKVEIYNPYAD